MPTIISSLRHVSIHIVWTERKTNPKSENLMASVHLLARQRTSPSTMGELGRLKHVQGVSNK